jgi:hypothetical protein
MASQFPPPTEAPFQRIPGAEALRDPQTGRYTPEYLACAACGALVAGNPVYQERHSLFHAELTSSKPSPKPESKGTRVGAKED